MGEGNQNQASRACEAPGLPPHNGSRDPTLDPGPLESLGGALGS